MPSAIVIRTAGTNCDAELVRALDLAGATTDLVHLDRLIADPARLDGYDLIAFPGGFSYGDDVASGRIFAMRTRERLYPALRDAARRGCPMIGVCNGFQVLIQVGLLPGPHGGAAGEGGWPEENAPPQEVALATNACGSFIDRWVRVAVDPASPCIWTAGLGEAFDADPEHADAVLRLPIAHGEGRFVAGSPEIMQRLKTNGQIPLRYIDDPNGSEGSVAGICDRSGRIFGLMPHPERYLDWTRHPFWTRLRPEDRKGSTPGLMIFRNAVEAATAARA